MCVEVLIFPYVPINVSKFCPYNLELSPDLYGFLVSDVFEFLHSDQTKPFFAKDQHIPFVLPTESCQEASCPRTKLQNIEGNIPSVSQASSPHPVWSPSIQTAMSTIYLDRN